MSSQLHRPCLLIASAAALLASGVAPLRAAPPEHSLRLMIQTAEDWPDPQALSKRLARLARVPVQGVQIVEPRRYSVTLCCRTDAACAAARSRIDAESSVVVGSEADARRSLPRRPTAQQSR